jgi:deazaflavin-dependent oxidoreductase (nitroreductase family)
MLGASPPRGVPRGARAAPRWLYRLHLGCVLGHRFLLLTHRGRRSGRLYTTVLEVARYDPATRESIVVSGWGDRANWYCNVQVAPALEIETGGQPYLPTQRFLTPKEVYRELRDYLRRHRWAMPIARRLFGLRFDGSDVDCARVATLRGVAFRLAGPAAGTSPPGQ